MGTGRLKEGNASLIPYPQSFIHLSSSSGPSGSCQHPHLIPREGPCIVLGRIDPRLLRQRGNDRDGGLWDSALCHHDGRWG